MAATLSPAQQQQLQRLTPVADRFTQGLQCYVVGGAVRDALLDQPAGDRDWVIVGSTPEAVAKRGFIPVGGDFPVFLHPISKEEYALARTERKSGRGYKGFTFYTGVDVSLEDDLQRRDLSINAMALGVDGKLVDPLNGLADLNQKQLRHVGDAFIEDPVRLLRLARFAARFVEFTIAEPTLVLAKQLVSNGEVDALVAERVWQELHKALAYPAPWRFFTVMHQVGALNRVFPGLALNERVEQALALAVSRQLSVAERYAVLMAHTSDVVDLSQRLRAPSDYRDLARLCVEGLHSVVFAGDQASAAERLQWLEACDALRRPERFTQLLRCLACYGAVDSKHWETWLQQVKQVDAGAIAKAYQGDGARIRQAVHQARIEALSTAC